MGLGGKRRVRSVECRKCGVWKMHEECQWKMRSVENENRCRECRVWKMRNVENENVENAECGK